jgi:L-ectoine synthase
MRNVDLVTKSDGLGFSIHDVRAAAGLEHDLWYKNHWEANYIVAGAAIVEDRLSGETWQLEPGAIYTVGPKDQHRFIAKTAVHLVSIFSPPVPIGADYDEDGALAPTGPVPDGRGVMFFKTVDELREVGREEVVAGGKRQDHQGVTARRWMRVHAIRRQTRSR